MENFFKKYFSLIEKNLNEVDVELLNKASLLIKKTASKKNKLIVTGTSKLLSKFKKPFTL